MPSILRIEYDPGSQFCTLFHSYNKRFVAFISGGITPASYRRFDPNSKKWAVHISRLPLVVGFGKRYFDHVDYRSLPEELQIKIVKNINNVGAYASQEVAISSGPHAVLFVLETAPWEVIQAAYKALALKLHPDHGGTTDGFLRLQEAFDELKSKYKP
jgi:hypothetical protein